MAKIGNWIFLACVATAMAGCAGDFFGSTGDSTSGGATGGTTSGGTDGRTYPTINLPSNGLVQVAILGGLDRRGTGSQVAVFDRIEFVNGVTDRIPDASQGSASPLSVVLDEYRVNTRLIPVTFASTDASRVFDEFPFEIEKLQEVQSDGTASDLPAATTPVIVSAQPFDVDLTVIPGRYTALQMRLDQDMVKFAPATGTLFDEDKFTAANYDIRTGSIRGIMSDFVAFDISSMAQADRPALSTGGAAEKVFFSGDGIAISRGIGTSSRLELLDAVAIKTGKIYNGPVINGQQAENSYTLEDTDTASLKVASLTGIWKVSTRVITEDGTVTMLALPNAADSKSQQVVIYQRNGNNISALWEGQVDYNADFSGGTLKLFPVNTVDDAIPSTLVATGTVSNLQLKNGAVMRGDWDLTGVAPAAWPFGTKGGFSVYRK